jgi:hypothetical protein
MLLRIAEFEANEEGMQAFLVVLGKLKEADRRSLAAAALAGFLHDAESARVLRSRIMEADDQIRKEIILALVRRGQSLTCGEAAKLLQVSQDTFVKGEAVGMILHDEEGLAEVYRQGLADGDPSVRAAVFGDPPYYRWMRSMAKEWLRRRLASDPKPERATAQPDIMECLSYLQRCYALAGQEQIAFSEDWRGPARRLLSAADQIDMIAEGLK